MLASLILILVSVILDLREVGRYIPSRWSDSYSPWYASQSALHGRDPYSSEVTRDIQIWFYGHTLDSDHPEFDVQAFVYPATAIPLFAITTWMPWKTFRIMFFLLAPPLVFMGAGYWANRTGVARSRELQWAIALIATASVPSFWGIQVMQPTVLVFVGITGVVALLSMDHYALAGAVLALATAKPNLVFILSVWLLIVMIRQRRWRFAAGFGIVFTTLLIFAEFLARDWAQRWYHAVVSYSHQKPSIFVYLFGRYASAALVVTIVLGVTALYRLGAPHQQSREFSAAVSLILSLTVCIIPNGPGMVYNQILLIPPMFYLASASARSPIFHVLRAVAIVFAWFTVASVPISVALILHYRSSVWAVQLPYKILPLPISVLAAAYLGCREVVTHPAEADPACDQSD